MYIDKTAVISEDARIGKNTKIWHFVQIREHASIGDNCIIGKNSYIDHHVKVGRNVKIQNNCSIYYKTVIGNGAFIGPHVIITNDRTPRAIDRKGNLKKKNGWKAEATTIKEGASIGAGSILLPGLTIGKYAMIGAGSVVTKDVSDYTLVYGNPARLIGSVCLCGAKIKKIEGVADDMSIKCPKCRQVVKTK